MELAAQYSKPFEHKMFPRLAGDVFARVPTQCLGTSGLAEHNTLAGHL